MKGCLKMQLQHHERTKFEGLYESNINLLCELAQKCQGYREGQRDETTGLPLGITPYAIMAKYLWKFQQDGIFPIKLAPNKIPDIGELMEAFHSNYEIKPGFERSKDPREFLWDYKLKTS